MLHLHALRLRNYSLFREQDITFEDGLTMIGGRNRVGKSLLFSSLRPLLFGLAHGDSLPKGSHVELEMSTSNTDGKMTRVQIGAESPRNKPDWTLHVNRQDMATHRKRDVRKLIDRRIGITEDLFDSTCHLAASGRYLPLYSGTPSFKMDWLSSVFNLSATYKQLERQVGSQLDELVKMEARLDALTKGLLPVPDKPDAVKYQKTVDRHAIVKKRIAHYASLRAVQEEYDSLRKLAKLLNKRQTDYTQRHVLEARIDKVEAKLEQGDAFKQELDEYQAELRTHAKAKDKRDALLQQLPEQLRPTSLKHTRQLIDTLVDHVDEIKRELDDEDEHADQLRQFKRAKAKLKTMSRPTISEQVVDKVYKRAQKDLHFAESMLRNINNAADDTHCAQCGTPMTDDHVHTVQKDYKSQRKLLRERLQEAEYATTWYQLRRIAAVPIQPVDWSARRKKLARMERHLDTLRQILALPNTPKPERPAGPKVNWTALSTELGRLKNDLGLFDAQDRSELPSADELDDRLRRLARQLGNKKLPDMEALTDEAIDLGETVARLNQQNHAYRNAVKHNAALEEEINQLRDDIKLLRPLRALKDAFGRSGIMLSSMNDVIEHLVQEINSLVPMLLDEKFRVEIVTGPRKLNVLIERSGSTASIRSISTSEQRCWALLFATAMLRILPNSMLVDTIILDELESNMDANSRKRYATEFLPFLQTIVPKVVVVTPLISGELHLQPDRAFRVEKQNNVSTLRAL